MAPAGASSDPLYPNDGASRVPSENTVDWDWTRVDQSFKGEARAGNIAFLSDDALELSAKLLEMDSELRQKSVEIGQLRETHSRAVLLPGGMLDRRLHSMNEAMDMASTSATFHTSRPFQAALSKPVVRWSLLAMAIAFAWLAARDGKSVVNGGYVKWKHYRISTWSTTYEMGAPQHVDSARPTWRGYAFEDQEHVNYSLDTSGDFWVFYTTFPTEQKVDGWYVQASELAFGDDMSVIDRDPAWATLEVSKDGNEWKTIDQQVWGKALQQGDVLGRRMFGDLAPSWRWALYTFGLDIVCISGFFCAFLGSIFGRPKAAKYIIIAMYLAGAVVCFVSGVGGRKMEQEIGVMFGAGLLIFPVLLLVSERLLLPALLANGVYDLVTAVTFAGQDVSAYQALSPTDVMVYQFQVGGWHLVVFVVIMVNILWVRHRTWRMIKPDYDKYNGVWSEMRNSPDIHASLDELALVCTRMQPARRGPLRQCNRAQPELPVGRAVTGLEGARAKLSEWVRRLAGTQVQSVSEFGVAGTIDRNLPVKSLDQLYSQAVFMHPVLKERVMMWAEEGNGCFEVLPSPNSKRSPSMVIPSPAPSLLLGPEFSPSPELDPARGGGCGAKEEGVLRKASEESGRDTVIDIDDPGSPVFENFLRAKSSPNKEVLNSFKFAKLKSISRAVEKTLRAYNGDPSYLLDICRQSIVFETVGEMVACLKIIESDKEVVIERVKNRMSEKHNPKLSGGYRDVMINLRITTPKTMDFGCETLILELQLIMKHFAVKKVDEGHKRYVEYRNQRAS